MRSTTAMIALTVIALTAAAAAATFAWQKNSEMERTKLELASAVSGMEKAKAAARSANEETSALRKELGDQRAALDQMRSQVAVAGAFAEAERAVSARLRQELAMANDKLAAVTGRPRPAAAAQPRSGFDDLRAVPVQMAPVPMRVIAVPAPAPASNAVRAEPAPVPSGGYSR